MEQIISKINIKKFILKAMLYIAFLWWGYLALLVLSYIFSDYLDAILRFTSKLGAILKLNISYGNDETEDFLFTITYTPLIFSFVACYLVAKLFGMFKFIDSLKMGIKLKITIIFLICVFSFLILFCKYSYIENLEELSLPFAISIFGLIPAFFLYKYFQYLTKKYPIPFEKIGYYSSIEFWKNLFFKKSKQELKK